MATFIEQSRLKLGLGQQELANYLQVTRSTFSMAEKNERHLPHYPYLILTELMANFPVTETPVSLDVILEKHTESIQHALEKRMLDNRYQLVVSGRKLETQTTLIQTHYNQLTTLSETLSALLKQSPSTERDRKTNWLQQRIQYTQQVALPRLAKDIALLRVRMAGLRAELEAVGFGIVTLYLLLVYFGVR